MHRKLIISLLILLFACGSIFIFWRQPVLLSILLLLLAYIKHRLCPIKYELLWFVLICVGGATVEGLLVNGAEAWNYVFPQFFGIPVWMPLFWGTVGTTVIVMHEGLIKTINKG